MFLGYPPFELHALLNKFYGHLIAYIKFKQEETGDYKK